ncbi:MAG: DMT family transporter [Acidimicrobiaceae bacterium]|nr:DMT family transporter [Acidimicrobiaceae bacterium]
MELSKSKPPLPLRWGIVSGTLAMVLVGSSVAVSGTLVQAPLFAVQAVRYAISVLLFSVIAKLTGLSIVRPRGREWFWLTGIATTGLVLFNLAVVRGVSRTGPAEIAVAVSCVPVVLGVVGPLLEGRVPSARVILAALVVTVGAVVVEGAGRTGIDGILWAVLALLCEAAFTLLAIPVLLKHGALGVSFHAVWIAVIELALISLLTEGPTSVARFSESDWLALLYLAFMVTAAAFLLWYFTVNELGAARAGLFTGVAPISAAFIGVAMGKVMPDAFVWLGMIIILIGLTVGLSSRRDGTPTEQDSPGALDGSAS